MRYGITDALIFVRKSSATSPRNHLNPGSMKMISIFAATIVVAALTVQSAQAQTSSPISPEFGPEWVVSPSAPAPASPGSEDAELLEATAQSRRISAAVQRNAKTILQTPSAERAARIEREKTLSQLGIPGSYSDMALERRVANELVTQTLDQRSRGLTPAGIGAMTFIVSGDELTFAPLGTKFVVDPASGRIRPELEMPEAALTSSKVVAPANLKVARIPGAENLQGPHTNSNTTTFKGGSCGGISRSVSYRGTTSLCYWKYRAHDTTNDADYWIYIQAVMGKPADISWDYDPAIRWLHSASEMTSASKSRIGIRGMTDHSPRNDIDGGCGDQVSVGVGLGVANASVTIPMCDSWKEFSSNSSYKRNRFEKVWYLARHGQVQDVGHATLVETAQRSWDGEQAYYNDYWYGEYCRGDFYCTVV